MFNIDDIQITNRGCQVPQESLSAKKFLWTRTYSPHMTACDHG